MKIAQVCHTYLPHIGGIELYVYRLTRDLNKNNLKTFVVTTDLDTQKEGRLSRVGYFKTNFSFMRNPFSFGLINHFLKNKYDILHLHNIWFIPGLKATLFRKKAKLIVTVHGVYPDQASKKLKFFLNLYKPFAKYILNKSDSIIALSKSEKDKLIDIFKINKNKIKVISNGIDLDDYQKTAKTNTILFTGRIIADKNPDLLIKASAILNKLFKDFNVLFVGPIEDSYKKELLKLAKHLNVSKKVEFKESISLEQRNKLMDIYRKSKVFVSIGSWEGLPTRLMEAMQFEVPCIAYSSGGSSELIKDNYNGLVINKLDENLLADKLNILFTRKNLYKKLGKNARATIVKDFNWNNISKEILGVYGR